MGELREGSKTGPLLGAREAIRRASMSSEQDEDREAGWREDGSWESRWPLLPGGSRSEWLYRCERWHTYLLGGRPIEGQQVLELEVLGGVRVRARLESSGASSLRVFLTDSGVPPVWLSLRDAAFHEPRRLRWPSLEAAV